MAGVFRDVTAVWNGEEYTFSPSNRILRRMESNGVNIAQLIAGLSQGSVSVPNLAFVAAEFLKIGGADVTEDQVYAHIMEGSTDDVSHLATWVSGAILPEPSSGKKPAGPRGKGKSRSPTPKKK